MRRIPDQRSTPRLAAAWVWWTVQCLIIIGLSLIPHADAPLDFPRIPRRDCSDLRLAERDREDTRARRQRFAARTRSRWQAIRARLHRLTHRTPAT